MRRSRSRASTLRSLAPDNYFLELQDHGIPEEETVRAGLVEIARRTGLPLVATNDSHYIRPEDAEAHDILLCLQTGARREEEKRFRLSGPEYYLASTQQMRERFAAYGEAVVQHRRHRGAMSRRDSPGAQPLADVLADPRGAQRRYVPAPALRSRGARSAMRTPSTTWCASGCRWSSMSSARPGSRRTSSSSGTSSKPHAASGFASVPDAAARPGRW